MCTGGGGGVDPSPAKEVNTETHKLSYRASPLTNRGHFRDNNIGKEEKRILQTDDRERKQNIKEKREGRKK
jgi:hypothetical protein